MSLVKSRELFAESAFPITVDTVEGRTLIRKELHRHEYFEMLYVEEGTLINRFKTSDITMKAGDIVIMKPFVRHVLVDQERDKFVRAYVCSFLPQTVDYAVESLEQLKSSSSPNRYYFKSFLDLTEEDVSAVQISIESDLRARLVEMFIRLRESTHGETELAHAQTRCDFLSLLILLAGQKERDGLTNNAVRITRDSPMSRYKDGLRKTLTHIHDHFKDPLSLSEMAAMSGASETYFCRLFKHETGMTFVDYLNSLRIESACIQLRDTTDNALDVCYEVGFNDYTHFGRQFKKNVGIPPAEFRRKNRRIRQIREI